MYLLKIKTEVILFCPMLNWTKKLFFKKEVSSVPL